MVSEPRTRRFALLVVFVVGGFVVSSVGRAAEGDASRPDVTADREQEARSLFAQGQVHYSLGEYAQAIGEFRKAYELTSAPGLLFNIAQAHRLAGQCSQALEVYRHFKRLAPDSPYRAEADTHIATLVVQCGATPAAAAPPTRDPVAKDEPSPGSALQLSQAAAPPERSRWSTRRKTAAALLAGGLGASLAAGALYGWNDGRYDQWRDEDRRLEVPAPGTPPAVWVADQQRNDALLQSIHRVDAVDLTLAGLSVAAVVASAVLLVVFDR
jgi:tetratricopeptide (TPR) repeat protein